MRVQLPLFLGFAQSLTKLRVGVQRVSALTDVVVASEQGFFKKHGLEVELVETRSGSEALSALQGGSIDITMAMVTFGIAANERGFGLVMVQQNLIAAKEPPDSAAIMVASNSPISSLSDLAGKLVATNALHGQDLMSAQYLLLKTGLAEGSVKYVEAPYVSMADVLKRGDVAAIVTVDPFRTMTQQRGIGRILAWPYSIIPAQPIAGFWAKRPWAEKNRKAIAAMGAATDEAIDYLYADPQRARMLVSNYTKLPAEIIATMPLANWSTKVDRAKWMAVLAMMKTLHEIEANHSPDEYFLSADESTVRK